MVSFFFERPNFQTDSEFSVFTNLASISNVNISFSDLGKRRRRRPSECRNRVLILTPGVSIREEREGEEEKKEERREKCGG